MPALRVVTVDDEPLARERVSALVESDARLTLVGEASNGLEALDLLTTLDPDLVFLDVEMPQLSGFGVIAALDGARLPGVVFVTAYEHYALRAFEVGAIDYLQKPITLPRFAAAVERARVRLDRAPAASALVAEAVRAERARGLRTRFVVRRGNTHHFVPVEQIDWIDVVDNYLRLHVGPRAHLSRGTMKDAEEELDPARFLRVHRSAMVAVDRIVSMRSHVSGVFDLELQGGVKLRTGRLYADQVRALLR